MKRLRFVTVALLLIVVLALAGCTSVLPTAATGLAGLAARTEAAPVVAVGNAAARIAPAGDLQATLEQIYEAANPAVVNIRVVQGAGSAARNAPNMPGSPSLPGSPFNQPQMPRSSEALGSGFVWDKQGHIVTNNHVVDGANQIEVTFADGLTVPATVVGADPESDLAVIVVDPAKASNLQPLAVADSTQVKVGQFTVAIGNPFGLEGTMTFGIVSALGRSLPASNPSSDSAARNTPSYTIPDIIQTDAPVNPGNSGGVLLDLDGRLIGVPSAIESSTGGSAGIGFAIPSAIVQQVVPALIETGRFEHPWIGISGGTLTSQLAAAMGLPETQRGALVVAVTAGSPAEKAGLQGSSKQVTVDGQDVRIGGDVIVAVDGQAVRRFEDLTTYLARQGKVGQTLKLTLLRDGKEMSVSLTLAARPNAQSVARSSGTQPGQPANPQDQTPRQDQPTQPQPKTAQGTAWLGVGGVTVTPEIAQAMNLSADQKGVLVQSVVTGSPAEKAGLLAGAASQTFNRQRVMVGGDVIVKANDKPVETIEALVTLVQGQKPGDTLTLTILRDGKEVKITATLAVRPTQTP